MNDAGIAKLAMIHKEALAELGRELATNFDVPAPRLINRAIAQMGITRVTYERIIHFQNEWEFQPIPQHLLDRWARY
jgi:hypothetical protein